MLSKYEIFKVLISVSKCRICAYISVCECQKYSHFSRSKFWAVFFQSSFWYSNGFLRSSWDFGSTKGTMPITKDWNWIPFLLFLLELKINLEMGHYLQWKERNPPLIECVFLGSPLKLRWTRNLEVERGGDGWSKEVGVAWVAFGSVWGRREMRKKRECCGVLILFRGVFVLS